MMHVLAAYNAAQDYLFVFSFHFIFHFVFSLDTHIEHRTANNNSDERESFHEVIHIASVCAVYWSSTVCMYVPKLLNTWKESRGIPYNMCTGGHFVWTLLLFFQFFCHSLWFIWTECELLPHHWHITTRRTVSLKSNICFRAWSTLNYIKKNNG